MKIEQRTRVVVEVLQWKKSSEGVSIATSPGARFSI